MSDTSGAPAGPAQIERLSTLGLIAIVGAIIVSIVVLGGFVAVSVMLFSRSIAPESKDIAMIMFGGLNSMAAGIVGFWVGSSIGSSQKNTTISQLSRPTP